MYNVKDFPPQTHLTVGFNYSAYTSGMKSTR